MKSFTNAPAPAPVKSDTKRSTRNVDVGACSPERIVGEVRDRTEPARPINEVEQYLTQVHTSIEELVTTVNNIERRMATVLRPEKCSAESCEKSVMPAVETQLASWLYEFSTRIRNQVARLNDYDNRCELPRNV